MLNSRWLRLFLLRSLLLFILDWFLLLLLRNVLDLRLGVGLWLLLSLRSRSCASVVKLLLGVPVWSCLVRGIVHSLLLVRLSSPFSICLTLLLCLQLLFSLLLGLLCPLGFLSCSTLRVQLCLLLILFLGMFLLPRLFFGLLLSLLLLLPLLFLLVRLFLLQSSSVIQFGFKNALLEHHFLLLLPLLLFSQSFLGSFACSNRGSFPCQPRNPP